MGNDGNEMNSSNSSSINLSLSSYSKSTILPSASNNSSTTISSSFSHSTEDSLQPTSLPSSTIPTPLPTPSSPSPGVISTSTAMSFFTLTNLNKYPQKFISILQNHLNDTQKNLLCGGIAGCVGKTIIAPLNRITILLQVSDHSGVSTLQTAIGIWKEEGLKAFWKGNLTSIIHRFPYSAINFSVYEILRDGICGRGVLEFLLLLTFCRSR